MAEPAERLSARPSRLGALACPQFARLLSGQVVLQVGTQMNNTAAAWVLYRLTHSAQALGLQGLCFSVPIAVLPLLAGVLADRFSRLALVKATLAAEAAQAFVLAALAGTGDLRPWMLYLAAWNPWGPRGPGATPQWIQRAFYGVFAVVLVVWTVTEMRRAIRRSGTGYSTRR